MWVQKAGNGVKLKENLVNTLAVTFLTSFSLNLVKMFVLINTRYFSKLGQVGSKCRSRGQIKGEPCEHSRGHIFDPILIKHGQNVCLNEY